MTDQATIEDIDTCLEVEPNLRHLHGSRILITGASGLIGSYLSLMLARYSLHAGGHLRIIASGRSTARLKERLAWHRFGEVITPTDDWRGLNASYDVIIHAAASATPTTLTTDPSRLLADGVKETSDLLHRASHDRASLLYISSSEIYGRAGRQHHIESDPAIVSPLNPRASYPIAKTVSENLIASYDMPSNSRSLIVRPSYIYGPTAAPDDSRLIPSLIRSARQQGRIELSSPGNQLRNWCYVGDCALAIIAVIANGEHRAAYNIADAQGDATIREVAGSIARATGVDLIAPPELEPTPEHLLDATKLSALSWHPRVPLHEGLRRTLAAI